MSFHRCVVRICRPPDTVVGVQGENVRIGVLFAFVDAELSDVWQRVEKGVGLVHVVVDAVGLGVACGSGHYCFEVSTFVVFYQSWWRFKRLQNSES